MFQAIINNIVRMILNWFAIIYLNNIAIYLKTLEKHIIHIK